MVRPIFHHFCSNWRFTRFNSCSIRDILYRACSFQMSDIVVIILLLSGSIDSYASSAAEAYPHFQPSAPTMVSFQSNIATPNGNTTQQQPQSFPMQQMSSLIDLQNSNSEEDFDCASDISTFIQRQKAKDDELASQKAIYSSLLQTHLSLKVEMEKLVQTRTKMEKDNVNLGEYGLSLQAQIQNLRNLPLMILQSRGISPATASLNGGIIGGLYAKSPQSGDSPQADATSSPSTYCESSITSPMTHQSNGLMSPLAPSLINNSVQNNQTSLFPNFNNNHQQGITGDANHSHHSMFAATSSLHHRGNPVPVNMVSSSLPFQGTSSVLNGQWTAH